MLPRGSAGTWESLPWGKLKLSKEASVGELLLGGKGGGFGGLWGAPPGPETSPRNRDNSSPAFPWGWLKPLLKVPSGRVQPARDRPRSLLLGGVLDTPPSLLKPWGTGSGLRSARLVLSLTLGWGRPPWLPRLKGALEMNISQEQRSSG